MIELIANPTLHNDFPINASLTPCHARDTLLEGLSQRSDLGVLQLSYVDVMTSNPADPTHPVMKALSIPV